MDPLVIGIIGMIALLVLVLYGVHIAVALGFVGFFGMVAILGFGPAYNLLATTMFTKVATFDFAVIPLFILMGMLATSLGLTKEIYECLSLWLSGIRGGLGIASVCACTAFGTLNGSALVTSSVFAKAAVPEMKVCMRMTLMMAACLIVIAQLFGPQMVSIFTPDPEVQRWAVTNLRIEIFAQVFYAGFLTYNTLATGCGDTVFVMWNSFVNCILVRLVLAVILEHFFGITGVYVACAIAPASSVPIGWWYYRKEKWKKSALKKEAG